MSLTFLRTKSGSLAVSLDDGETIIAANGREMDCTDAYDVVDGVTALDLTPAAQEALRAKLARLDAQTVRRSEVAQERAEARERARIHNAKVDAIFGSKEQLLQNLIRAFERSLKK